MDRLSNTIRKIASSRMLNRLLLFIMAACVGSILVKLHLPIPFLMGGMLTAIFCKTFIHRMHVDWPQRWRGYGLMVGGYGIGSTFNAATWNNFLNEIAGVAEATFIALSVSIVLAFAINRCTKFNLQSCVMGMLPGGLTLMMLMSEEDPRANPNVVMVMQVIRLLGVVISVPFLVVYCLDAHVTGSSIAMPNHGGIHWLIFIPLTVLGVFLARKLHLPTPQLLGSILMTAIFAVLAGNLQPVPAMLMAPAQISIGLYMGQLLDSGKISQAKTLLPLTILATAVLIVISMGVAYNLSSRYGFTLITAFLAMAPGGIAEMSLAGMSMGEDVSIILTYQLVRILSISLLVPPLLLWYFKEK